MNLIKYSDETKDYLTAVYKFLCSKFGRVSPEWEGLLMLLGDNLDLYKQCLESVAENGIYDVSTGKKNPLLTTMKDLQATIMKQIQHFGLSPYAIAKIQMEEEDNSDEFIKSLTGEE